jgi:uncharacterized protein RhaS with RHS repeats
MAGRTPDTLARGLVLTISYSGGGLSYTQSFGYDGLNRLTTSQETNGGTSWSQTNGYDRYGNRWVDLGGGSQSLYFNASSNRITGASYDSAGNLLNDGSHAYTFNGENLIRTVDNQSAYACDGEGRRVRKLLGENLRLIYGIGGELIAEFDGASGALKKEYIYGASGLLATIEPTALNSNGTRYTTADHLGSPRVLTNSSAGVVSRHDYMPFGEELLPASAAARQEWVTALRMAYGKSSPPRNRTLRRGWITLAPDIMQTLREGSGESTLTTSTLSVKLQLR